MIPQGFQYTGSSADAAVLLASVFLVCAVEYVGYPRGDESPASFRILTPLAGRDVRHREVEPETIHLAQHMITVELDESGRQLFARLAVSIPGVALDDAIARVHVVLHIPLIPQPPAAIAEMPWPDVDLAVLDIAVLLKAVVEVLQDVRIDDRSSIEVPPKIGIQIVPTPSERFSDLTVERAQVLAKVLGIPPVSSLHALECRRILIQCERFFVPYLTIGVMRATALMLTDD